MEDWEVGKHGVDKNGTVDDHKVYQTPGQRNKPGLYFPRALLSLPLALLSLPL